MPITPFHFGPGLLAKGLLPSRVSWTAFCAANVLIDCETLYHILTEQYPLHTHLHTFIGAGLAGAATGAVLAAGRPLLAKALGFFVPPAVAEAESAPAALWGGALLGGLSHPLLDGIMHQDIMPFRPFTDANPLLDMVGSGNLHSVCIIAGCIGLVMTLRHPRR